MSSVTTSFAAATFQEALELLRGLPLPHAAEPPPLDLVPMQAAEPHERQAPPATLTLPAGSGRCAMPKRLTCLPTLPGAAASIAGGELTARELVERSIAAIGPSAHLGTVVAIDEEDALRQADALDEEVRRTGSRGPLHGIPITVKDVIDVAGLPTRAGSEAYDDLPTTDARSVAQLREAGAVILAKVATHEFALGVATPQCRNPYAPSRLAGGSSGGSALAVATGVGIASLATDTRASLRVPASLCGVVGFKPTFGRVSTRGVVPLSWTIDHVGPIAQTVEDAALLLATLTDDPRIAFDPAEQLAGMVIGVPEALDTVEPSVEAAFEASLRELERLGCRLVSLDCPSSADLEVANALGMLVSRCEAATFHRAQGTDLDRCIPEVRDQLTAALRITATDYLDAQRQRELLAARILAAFAACDIVATPTTPMVAPPRDDYERYLLLLSRNLIMWSLVGAPALSLPSGTSADGLPTGLQLAAPPWGERRLVTAGVALERALRA
jgi:aspartyl-tRNA(Asn)/glutamyl-tRNA(Gln) amidotransferase subunit A